LCTKYQNDPEEIIQGDNKNSSFPGNGQAGGTRKCRKTKDPYHYIDDQGNCTARNKSKGKYHNCKGNILEVDGDLEEILEVARNEP
jgi:hypothetical protein